MKILITGAFSCSKEQINKIEALGHKVEFLQQESDTLPCPEIFDAIICNGLFLHHKIEDFKNLKYIQLTSAGFDRVPMDYIAKHNISIYNARGVYSVPMAEFAVCGVLQLYKQSRFFTKNQASHNWEKHRKLLELYRKTVCVVGSGSVGTECAKRFSAFGCNCIGVDAFPYKSDVFDKILSLDSLNEALSESDIVILTLPLTDKTKHMFNKELFSHFNDGAVFVNIARGEIVDTEALIDSLKQKLFGAVLDVFEEEPLSPLSPLWNMENVILTPHNSFVGEGNNDRLFNVIYNNLNLFIEGR